MRIGKLCLVRFDKPFFLQSRRWLNDPEIQRLTMTPPCDETSALRWFESLGHKTDYIIWGVQYNGIPIGACGIKHISDGAGEYWGYIGEKTCWGKGIGVEMMSLLEQEARCKGIRRLYLHVAEDNLRALRLYQKTGFTEAGSENNLLLMTKEL